MGLHFSVISGVEHSSIYSKNRTSFNMGKGEKLGFAENFMLSGVAAAVSKTAAAPIERVKLLVQNQGEMLKQGTLTEPYKGVLDCTSRTMKNEGLVSFWRGNLANVIRYFPTQALNFAFKDTVKALFKTAKDAPQYEKFGKNILSGGCAGSMSLFFVYSLDYCRTRLANDAKTKSGTRQYNGMIDVYTKQSNPMVFKVCTVDLLFHVLVSSSIVECTLDYTVPLNLLYLVTTLAYSCPSFLDGSLPLLLALCLTQLTQFVVV